MALQYDVDTLISQVRLSENIPDGAQVFTDSDLVVFMNEELQGSIVPTILDCREEYLTVTRDFVFPSASSPITNTIEIPSEAIGYRLREVFLLDSNGNFFSIPRLTPTQAATFSSGWNPASGANSGGFYVQGNTVFIYPYTAARGNTFRLLFHRRPAELVTLAECGQITAINVLNGLLSLNNIPTTWTASTTIDVIQPTAPFNFVQGMFASNTVYTTPAELTHQVFSSAPSGNQVFVSALLADQLAVGQYVVQSGTSPFVQFLPPDIYPLLKQGVAIRCLRALNDTEAEQMAIQKYKWLEEKMVKGLLTPRVEGKGKKIFSNSTIGDYIRNRWWF